MLLMLPDASGTTRPRGGGRGGGIVADGDACDAPCVRRVADRRRHRHQVVVATLPAAADQINHPDVLRKAGIPPAPAAGARRRPNPLRRLDMVGHPANTDRAAHGYKRTAQAARPAPMTSISCS